MKNSDYHQVTLSTNRRAVIASASVTREKNAIHSLTEVDVSRPRALIKEYYERSGEKLSFTAYIVACLAEVIPNYPQFNSFIKGRKLVILDDVTISVLIEREIDGEKVPEPIGIQAAQKKSYLQIHKEIRETNKQRGDVLETLSGKAWLHLIPSFMLKTFVRLADRNINMAKRYGKLAVTAVGMFSKEPAWFIPHGSATVLITVGSISKKVIEVEEGKFESREHLCLTVSFDHNIVDGAPASRFMNDFVETARNGDILQRELSSNQVSAGELTVF